MISSNALPYSRALFDLFPFQEKDEESTKNLDQLFELSQKVPLFLDFLSSKAIPYEKKIFYLTKWVKNHLEEKLFHFLVLLIKRNHIQELPQIILEYRRLIAHKRGILEAKLELAQKVDSAKLEQLKKRLEFLLKKEIHLIQTVDEGLIGGGLLTIDNQRVDFSLKGKLNRLKNHLTHRMM